MMIVEIYCNSCKRNPCHCGKEYMFWAEEGRERLTKAVNNFSIKDLLNYLEQEKMLNVDNKIAFDSIKKHFKYKS